MSLKAAIFSTTSLVFLATSAVADVTAKDIWNDWTAYMAGFGYTIDGTETMSGNTLAITDLTMSVPMPDAAGDFAITASKVDFVENGDGTVNVIFPDVMPMRFAATGPEGEPISGALDYTMSGMNMRASGDPSEIIYDYSADQIGLALRALTLDGDTFPEGALKIALTSNGLNGQSIMQPGALRKVSQNIAFGETGYEINYQDPDSSDAVVFNGKMATLSFTGDTILPTAVDPEDMAQALNDGLSVNGAFGYTGSTTQFAFTNRGDTTGGSSGAASSEVGVRMDKNALEYTATSERVNFNLTGGEIPLPIMAELGEVAFNLLMPVAKSDDASDFAFGLTLGDFVTSDDLWSMLDPAQILPRDPATISLDLVGKAKMLVDFFDPEQMSAVEDGDAMPAELNAVTLRKLLVSAAGATLSGTGDFTFDNSDVESFGGFPKPTGGIDISLVGGNGLMDKLVEMGLLPQEQAMGARMMMGLFTRPGESEDSLTSKIEINEAGHILANGQRIQ